MNVGPWSKWVLGFIGVAVVALLAVIAVKPSVVMTYTRGVTGIARNVADAAVSVLPRGNGEKPTPVAAEPTRTATATRTATPTVLPPTSTPTPLPTAVPSTPVATLEPVPPTDVPTLEPVPPTPTPTPTPKPTPVLGARLSPTRETTNGLAISVGPDDILHIAWADESEGSPAIFYARSDDGGATFSVPLVVASGADAEARGAPAIAGGPAGTVALAWEEKRAGAWGIAFSRSTDGASFTEPTLVGAPSRQSDRVQPALAAGPNGVVYLAWRDLSVGDTGGIFFARTALSGSFGEETQVSPFPEIQEDPVLAVDGMNRVHVAWSDRRDGPFAVYYARADDGVTFGVARRISEAGGNHIPSLAVDDHGGIHIAWASSFFYVYHTYYAVSADGGDALSPGTMVNDGGPSVSVAPPLTAVGVSTEGTVYVAFLTDSPRDGKVIHYDRRSGSAFGTDVTVAGGKEAHTLSRPAMATGSQGRVFLAWGDSEEGRFQVHVAEAKGGNTFRLEEATRVQD
jgi:hypothetical protein